MLSQEFLKLSYSHLHMEPTSNKAVQQIAYHNKIISWNMIIFKVKLFSLAYGTIIQQSRAANHNNISEDY